MRSRIPVTGGEEAFGSLPPALLNRDWAALWTNAPLTRSCMVCPSLALAQLNGSLSRMRLNPLASARSTAASSSKVYTGVLFFMLAMTNWLSCSPVQSSNCSDSAKRLFRPVFLMNMAAILSGYPARMTTILCCKERVKQFTSAIGGEESGSDFQW